MKIIDDKMFKKVLKSKVIMHSVVHSPSSMEYDSVLCNLLARKQIGIYESFVFLYDFFGFSGIFGNTFLDSLVKCFGFLNDFFLKKIVKCLNFTMFFF